MPLAPLTPLPNMGAALVIVRGPDGRQIGKGFILDPWNRYFQQFGQVAPTPAPVTGASPFSYTANTKGSFFIIGGTVSNITLTRGTDTFNLTGEKVIPISIGDTVTVTYSVLPAMTFLGA
jgi:hypothetical protein